MKLNEWPQKPSILIIGAGVMGLSIGWQLAREGLSVHILEQGYAGKQASWAAAGMLAPFWEAAHEEVGLLEIGKQSLALYPQFLQELGEDGCYPLPIESAGTLCVALDRDDREWLLRHYAFKQKNGMPVHWLSAEEARHKEPLLSPRVNSGVWIPAERQINNRLLVHSLKNAFLAKGGILSEQLRASQLVSQGKILGIRAQNGQQYDADVVINAAGAWANHIHPSLASKEEVHLRPVKGQILSLSMPSHLSLQHVIRTPRIYLAPKQEGIVRVGATSEELGFNVDITAGAVLDLLKDAWEVIPALSEYGVEEIMAGLRPVTANHMPFLGASSVKGLYHAIGHGRSGILLAPYTAYTLKQLIKQDYPYANSL